MRKLEAASEIAWATLGANAKEYVALGFEDPEDETITWFPLTNVAEPGEFYVEPEEVVAVLAAAQRDLDPACVRYLWHSHYIAVEPSEADLSNFPEWVDVGIVFHAPTRKVTLYNAVGIIPNIAISERARDTMEV